MGEPEAPEKVRRDEASRRTADDLERLRARPTDDRFWSMLRVVGSVGWPIVSLALLGAAVGRWLDRPGLTALLIAAGALLGTWVALANAGGAR